MLFYSFRRVFGAASSEPQNVETESAESAGIPFSFHDLLIYICNVIFVIFVFHHLTIMKYFFVHSVLYRFYIPAVSYLSFIIRLILFCKQHCHQETLKSRFQSSTFCRFFASSYFDKVYIRIACSTLFINHISPILSRCSFLVKVRCPVSRESV